MSIADLRRGRLACALLFAAAVLLSQCSRTSRDIPALRLLARLGDARYRSAVDPAARLPPARVFAVDPVRLDGIHAALLPVAAAAQDSSPAPAGAGADGVIRVDEGFAFAAWIELPSPPAPGRLRIATKPEGWSLEAYQLPPEAAPPPLRDPAALATVRARLQGLRLGRSPDAAPGAEEFFARPARDCAGLLVLALPPRGGGEIGTIEWLEISPLESKLLPADGDDPRRRIVAAGPDFRESLLLWAPGRVSFEARVPTHRPRLVFAHRALAAGRRASLRVIVERGHERTTLITETVTGEERFRRVVVPLERFSGAEVSLQLVASPADGEDAPLPLAIAHPVLLGGRTATPRRPDLVLVVLDTLRADRTPCDAGPSALTPHLAAFARRALVFRRAVSASSWTLPSHASIFTGRWPQRHGVLLPRSRLDPRRHTPFPERLRDAGYRTVGFCGSGFVHADFGFALGFERYVCRDLVAVARDGDGVWRRRPEPLLGELAAVLDEDDPRPLFLFVHTFAAHNYRCTDEDLRAAAARYAVKTDLRGAYPPSKHPYERRRGAVEEDYRDAARLLYDGSVHLADRFLGEVLDLLDRSPRFRNAYVVVTSDHGEELFEHGWIGHGASLDEEQIRVPLVVRGPTVRPRPLTFPVSGVDLAPTLLDLAGVPLPPGLDGRSLVPLFGGGSLPERPAVAALRGLEAIRSGRWKLVRDTRRSRPVIALYDLEAPGREAPDLAEERPRVAARLLAELQALVPTTPATAPTAPLSPERRAELEALGYLGGGASGRPAGGRRR